MFGVESDLTKHHVAAETKHSTCELPATRPKGPETFGSESGAAGAGHRMHRAARPLLREGGAEASAAGFAKQVKEGGRCQLWEKT